MKHRLVSLRTLGSVLLALCLLLSVAPAMAEDAPTITVMFPSANIPADNGCVVEAIRAGSGVNIQLNVLSYDDYANKVATMLVSNSLPDIFLSTDPNMTKDLAENGVILPLDELLASQGADILACKQDQLKGACTVDGQIYAISTLGTENSSTLTLRKDWLDNLGLAIPTTPEEYYEVLRAFTQDDPNKNGVDDTIGLGAGGSTSHIFGAYGVNISYPNYENGQVVPALLCENYLPAIRFLNRLYNEGLYDREFLTLDTMTAYGKLWNGFVGAFEFNPNGTTQNWLWRYTEEVKPEFCFTVIRGEDGVGGTPRTIMDGSYAVVINAQCKQPEAAMQFLNYLCTDAGDELSVLGIEGTHFKWTDKENGVFEMLPPYDSDAAKLREDGLVFGNLLERNLGVSFKTLNATTREGKNLARENNLPDAYLRTTPQISLDLGSVLNDLCNEATVQLTICAPEDIDALYAQYVQTYLASGGSTWIEQATAIYKAQEGIE